MCKNKYFLLSERDLTDFYEMLDLLRDATRELFENHTSPITFSEFDPRPDQAEFYRKQSEIFSLKGETNANLDEIF